MPDEPEVDYEEPEEFDEEAEIERRRKRRGELLAKSSSATPLLLHAVGAATSKAQALSPASFQSDTPQASQRSDSQMAQSPRSSKPHAEHDSSTATNLFVRFCVTSIAHVA
jgi:serine/threonine-protein kinase PRP4